MKYFLFLVLIMTISCQNNLNQNKVTTANSSQMINTAQNILVNAKQENSIQNQSQVFDTELEHFVDEHKIGNRKLNRIEISTYKKDKRFFVKTRFYAKSKLQWVLKNEFDIEKFGGLPIQPEIKDFNGDGFKDITFVSAIAARGSNDVRKLFIYNPRNDDLIYIKNSSDYPNLGYNPLLKCLDSLIFTASTTTVFLKLEGDKLVEFASVDDIGTERRINITDRNGEKKLLRREERKDEGFYRYINYNPVQTYRN